MSCMMKGTCIEFDTLIVPYEIVWSNDDHVAAGKWYLRGQNDDIHLSFFASEMSKRQVIDIELFF